MNTSFPSPLAGGFEVLEIPDDPYHGTRTRACQCENCSVTGQANPAFFEYYDGPSSAHPAKQAKRDAARDAAVLALVFLSAAVLFYILTNTRGNK